MPPWVTIIITSATSILVAVISSGWFAKKMNKKDTLDDITARLDAIEQKLEENQKRDEVLTEANIAMLRDRFTHLARQALRQGSITWDDLENLKKLSKPYFELDDEDGTGHILMSRVEALPLKKASESQTN